MIDEDALKLDKLKRYHQQIWQTHTHDDVETAVYALGLDGATEVVFRLGPTAAVLGMSLFDLMSATQNVCSVFRVKLDPTVINAMRLIMHARISQEGVHNGMETVSRTPAQQNHYRTNHKI